MAAPAQVPPTKRLQAEADAKERQQVVADAKECAKSLKTFLESTDGPAYLRFKETFDRYYGYSQSKDKAEQRKGELFRDAFFGTEASAGEYGTQMGQGRSAALDSAFKASHPEGFLPNALADAAYEVYSRCARGEQVPPELDRKHGAQFVRATREAYYAAHPEKVSVAPPSDVLPVRLPPPPGNVTDATIDTFLRHFEVQEQFSGEDRDGRYRGVVATVMMPFNLKNLRDAGDITAALMQAYQRLGDDDKKQFLEWLSGMEQNEKAALGAGIVSITRARSKTLPQEEVKKRFESWKSGSMDVKQKIYSLEAGLKAYPAYIRETSLSQMAGVFEKSPRDYTLEQMEMRMLYLLKKRDILVLKRAEGKAELSAVDKELSAMQSWLGRLDINERTPEAGLSALRAGFVSVQLAYYTMSSDNPRLADMLDRAASNKGLFLILTTYVSELDKHALGLFKDAKPGDPAFTASIRMAVQSRDWTEKVNRGREAWQAEYYPLLAAASGTALPTPSEARMYALAGSLDTASAVAFIDYVETARKNGLEGGLARSELRTGTYVDANGHPVTVDTKNGQRVDGSGHIVDSSGAQVSSLIVHEVVRTGVEDPLGTRKLIVDAVARLYAVHPALVSKYFNSIRHIAEICENNSKAFHDALAEMNLSIFAETEVLVSRSSPSQITPINIRKTMERLDEAFSEISKISPGSLAQFDRFNLLDRQLYIDQFAPHVIHQRQPAWAPRLLTDEAQSGGLFTPYPFGNSIITPVPGGMFTAGGVYTSQPNYGGGLTLPSMRPLQVFTSVAAVQAAMYAYLWPQHPVLSISRMLPGVTIEKTSQTKLLIEIRRAFVQTDRPEYASLRNATTGGLAAGVMGEKTDKWNYGGGALGTLLTPTGGFAAGGLSNLDGTYGGMSWLAVPIGTVKGTEISLDTSLTGVEKLSDNSWKILQRAISTQWKPPNADGTPNTSQTLVVLNSDATADGKWYTTARILWVAKDGTIYDLMGGQNDLVPMLNFMAGYTNKAFATPSTAAFNYEPEVARGGGALVFDVGKTPILLHTQAVPFLTGENEPQPLLVQWTLAGAHTVETGAEKTDIHALAFPGQLLTLKPGTDGSQPQNYVVQDVDYMLRRVRKASAWELSMGGGYAHTPVGSQGQGGFFLRTQNPGWRLGGGSYYQGNATNLQALALLQQSQEAVDYVSSIHRIASTIYGSREKVFGTSFEAGGLLHVVNQLQEASGSLSYDTTFFRAVGLLSGLRSAARFDFSRVSGMDEMLSAYDSMASKIGDNPSQAAAEIANFKSRYSSAYLQQVMDKYYFGVQINKDFSIEGLALMREEGNKWANQELDTVYARGLWTFNVGERAGFMRAFASMPLLTPSGVDEKNPTVQTGIVGAGAGFDLFDSVFLQRIAADAGMMVSRIETGASSTEIDKWAMDRQKNQGGYFVQGAAAVYSGLAEDSRSYRRLLEKLENYKQYIRDGAFSKIRDDDAREAMCRNLDSKVFGSTVIEDIRQGRDFTPTPAQASDLEDALWRNWFSERKMEINERFSGNMRVLLGASRYKYFGGPTYWDVGMFVESVDRFKMYAIVAKREETGLYAGAEYAKNHLRLALGGGATPTTIGGAASIGYRFVKADIPMELGLSVFGTSAKLPQYAAPMWTNVPTSMTPQFGGMFYYTIGAQGPPAFLQAPTNTRLTGPGQYP